MFENLPNEMTKEILDKLSPIDRDGVKRVCLLWYYLPSRKNTAFSLDEQIVMTAEKGYLTQLASLYKNADQRITTQEQALYRAAANGHAECVLYLIEKYKDNIALRQLLALKRELIGEMVMSANAEGLKKLLGWWVEELKGYFHFPENDYLRSAIKHDLTECVSVLLEKYSFSLFGNHAWGDGKNQILLFIIQHDKHQSLSKFLEKCAEDIGFDICLQVAFNRAAEYGAINCLKLLLEKVPDGIMAHNFALTEAAENGHDQCVTLLLKEGNIDEFDIQSALDEAKGKNHEACVKLLNAALTALPAGRNKPWAKSRF